MLPWATAAADSSQESETAGSWTLDIDSTRNAGAKDEEHSWSGRPWLRFQDSHMSVRAIYCQNIDTFRGIWMVGG